MRDFIIELYEALENFDCEKVGRIYFGIRDGNIITSKENIVPLCEMFTYEFQDTDTVNDQLIIKITFHIIDSCGKETGFQELLKGLIKIYNVSEANYGNKKRLGNTHEGLIDYIQQYINTFIASYEDADMIYFGELIKLHTSLAFKDSVIRFVEGSLKDYMDENLRKVKRITGDIVRKRNLLIENIKD